MHRWIVTIAIVTALGLTVWGGFGLNAHLIAAVDKWGDSNPTATLGKLNSTLDAINAPCSGFHGSTTCGPIAQLSQTEKNIGIVAAKSAQQVQQSGVLIQATASTLTKAGDSVALLSNHLDKTADALTETAQGASVALGTANSSIAALLPLESAYTATGQDLDAVIRENSPSLHASLVNVAGMTDNGNGILVDLRKMSDKAEHDLDAPKPWWERGLAAGNDLVRAGCLITGRCP
jgi:hypothetical protein